MYGFGWNEDKPAPKYKAGDRVKVIKNALGRTFPVGEFGTIKEVLGHGVTVSRDGGDDYGWFFGPDEIEPAPAQVVQGRYRVGDRVRVVKNGHDEGGSLHGAKVGDVDEIVAIDKSDPHPYEGRQWYYGASEIAPAFRPGDRVRLNKHSGVRACGERGTVSAVIGDNVSVRMDDASTYGTVVAFFHADNLDWEREEDCPVKPERKDEQGVTLRDILGDALNTSLPDYQPCIVALISNGKPRPSSYPHVHASVEAATKEAERLARNNPGQEFAVYQRVAGRVAEQHVEMKEVA